MWRAYLERATDRCGLVWAPSVPPTGSKPSSASTCGRRLRPRASAAAPGGSSSGRSTRWRRLDRSRPRVLDPLQRPLAAEELDALEEAGRDLRAGDRDAD